MTWSKQYLHNQSRQSYATIANKGEKLVSTSVKKRDLFLTLLTDKNENVKLVWQKGNN